MNLASFCSHSCTAQRAWSNKTRIKTLIKSAIIDINIGLREHGPIKQGLRLLDEFIRAFCNTSESMVQ